MPSWEIELLRAQARDARQPAPPRPLLHSLRALAPPNSTAPHWLRNFSSLPLRVHAKQMSSQGLVAEATAKAEAIMRDAENRRRARLQYC